MSAEYVPIDHTGGGAGGHTKKGLNIGKFLKSPVFLIGVGVIVVFIFIRGRKSSGPVQDNAAPVDYPNPQNSVDTAAQMQNLQSIVESEINQAIAQSMGDVSQQIADIGEQSQNYTDQVKQSILDQVNNNVNNHPVYSQQTPEQVDPVTKELAAHPFGDNGVGWDPKTWQTAKNRLQNDSTYRKQEIKRTMGVIQNRKAAGLDTKNQQIYLKQLNQYGG